MRICPSAVLALLGSAAVAQTEAPRVTSALTGLTTQIDRSEAPCRRSSWVQA